MTDRTFQLNRLSLKGSMTVPVLQSLANAHLPFTKNLNSCLPAGKRKTADQEVSSLMDDGCSITGFLHLSHDPTAAT